MKLSKTLLSALLLGITVQTTTSCEKKELPQPNSGKEESSKEQGKEAPVNCPGCGMG
ncbi:chryseobasin-related MNIO class RiPP peptide [Adhaeribacter arboris]|uniref:chryseobasin-related MNIO class RiPP peptide n=1 Tax=Adhaeribacter arboris TaxID=2072846 RepID=UPI001304F26E|nr:hypothetical protein [Adhaeribacter arboris]